MVNETMKILGWNGTFINEYPNKKNAKSSKTTLAIFDTMLYCSFLLYGYGFF
jgi:hypothetical protein